MKNKYGNFVILKMLSVIEVEDKQLLMNALYKCLQHLTIVKYRTRWITFINENPLKIPNIPSAQGIQTFKPSLFKNQNPQIGEEQNPYIRGQNTEYYGNVIQNTNEMYAGGGNEWDQEPIQNLQQNYNIPQQQQHLNLNMQNQYQQYYYNQGNQNQNQMMNLQQQNQQQNINNQYGGFFNPNMQNQQQQAYMQQQPQYQQQMLQQQYQQQMQQQKQQQQQQQYSNYKKQQPVPKQGMNSKWHNDKDHHGKGFDRFDN